MRAIWKGFLQFADVRIPVKLYSAVQDRSVHFRLLHQTDGVPVKQRYVDSQTGEVLDKDQIQRGYEVEPGSFVRLREAELEALTPPPSRDIDVTSFIPVMNLDDPWLDRPYFVGPDGSHSDHAALTRMLHERGWAGIARWVMRKHHYTGALFAQDEALVLMTLRSADAVVALPELPDVGQSLGSPRERALAEQLIAALADDFDADAYHDDYRERLLSFLEQKARGETPALPTPKRPAPARPLGDVLRASVREAQERRSA